MNFRYINDDELTSFIEVIINDETLPSELEYIRDEYSHFLNIIGEEEAEILSKVDYDDDTLIKLGFKERDNLLLIPLFLIPLLDKELTVISILGDIEKVGEIKLISVNGYTMYGIPKTPKMEK